MNAYELADALAVESSQMEYGYVVDDWELLYKSAQMLRQQADRIAELEKDGKVCATCGGLVYDPVIKQTKPLSDEEIKKLIVNKVTDYELCRAIEERHGIK